MCDEDAILFEEDSINHSTYKPGEEFEVLLKVILYFIRLSDQFIRMFRSMHWLKCPYDVLLFLLIKRNNGMNINYQNVERRHEMFCLENRRFCFSIKNSQTLNCVDSLKVTNQSSFVIRYFDNRITINIKSHGNLIFHQDDE